MAIPQIVPGSEVQGHVAGARMDTRGQRAAALMEGQVGLAAGEAGSNFFGMVSEKIQDARNAKTVFDADLTMQKTHDDFLASLTTNPELAQDPGKWMPAYKEQVAAVREQVMSGGNMGPKVKAHVGRSLDNWEQQTTASLNTAALLRETDDTKRAGLTNAAYSFTNGDIDGGRIALKSLVEVGVMGPKEAAAHFKIGMDTAYNSQANAVINADPIHAPEAIKRFEGKMNPLQYKSVVRAATESMHRQQSANLDDLAGMMDESPDGTIDPKLIKAKVAANEISSRGGQALVNRMTQANLARSREDLAVLEMEVLDHDWTEDKTPEATAQLFKDQSAGLPAAMRVRANKAIDRSLKEAKTKAKAEIRPVEAQIMEQMREDRYANGYTIPVALETKEGGVRYWDTLKSIVTRHPSVSRDPTTTSKTPAADSLSDLRNPEKVTDEQIQERFGKGMTREKLIRAEQVHSATIQGKMREWLHDPANKDATYEQANEYRITLEKPFVMAKVSNELKPKPGYKTKEAVRDAYRSGVISKAEAKKIISEQFGE